MKKYHYALTEIKTAFYNSFPSKYPHTWILLAVLYLNACTKIDDNPYLKVRQESSSATQNKMNIILILADDVGYEIPTYTGGQSYSTPNLDYLAAQGTQFTQAHTAPLCSPSRVMLLTAKYNFRNYTTWGVMDTSQKTIANLLKKSGYATCMAGKWQFDGGDASIHAFGFDKYIVTNPFILNSGENVNMYKNPEIYENGTYWPNYLTKGKYGENIIRDYMFNFIDSVKNKKPFFIYWATNLVHEPFCPTPDDPQFAAWDPTQKKQPGDTVYFASMVKYHDKLIGQLLRKLRNDSISDNTLILWLGDNGTNREIHCKWNGQVVGGGKSLSTEAGTHVPMLAYMPGLVPTNAKDSGLISLVDFMPTIGDAAGVAIPGAYGTTDGISFYNQLSGNYSSVRPWIFCHSVGSGESETNLDFLRRWMQDYTYKQYDSLPNKSFSKKFYNIIKDPLEKNPINPLLMTPHEKKVSKQFLTNMSQLH